jgi:hypothetical protein
MPSSGMLRRVAPIRTDYSEGCSALVTANNVPNSPIFVTLIMEAIRSTETSVLTGSTRRSIPDDGILHSHRRENFKSYITLTGWTL